MFHVNFWVHTNDWLVMFQVGTGVTNALIKARKAVNTEYAGEVEDVPILSTSVAYGVYMAVSSNLRYVGFIMVNANALLIIDWWNSLLSFPIFIIYIFKEILTTKRILKSLIRWLLHRIHHCIYQNTNALLRFEEIVWLPKTWRLKLLLNFFY